MSDIESQVVNTERAQSLPPATDVQPPATPARSLSAARVTASNLVPYARFAAQKIGHVGIVGLSLCIFSIATFLTANGPLHQRVATQSVDLDAARAAAGSESRADQPDLQSASAKRLVGELPNRNDLPQVMGQIVAIAAASGLALDRGNYDFSTTDSSSIARYSLSLPVRGSYPQVRQFVENTLAAIPVLALDKMRFERNEVADQTIEADLEFAVLVGSN